MAPGGGGAKAKAGNNRKDFRRRDDAGSDDGSDDEEARKKKKAAERGTKRKPVSKRTMLKRRQEFDIRALSKGVGAVDDEDVLRESVNSQWAKYYGDLLKEDEDESSSAAALATLQRQVVAESPDFLFTAYWSLGFPRLPPAMKKLVKEVTPHTTSDSASFSTYAVAHKDLTAEFKEFLERESRLGRCTLKRTRAVVEAMQGLQVRAGDVVLDTLADEESHELCVSTMAAASGGSGGSTGMVALQRKTVPCFDSPSAVWQSLWSPSAAASQFDRILCRVPNTQDGAMRSRKDWLAWKTSNGKDLALLQLKIALELASKHLAPGGRMAYVTGSINPVENEHVVAELVKLCQGELTVLSESKVAPTEPGGGGYVCVLEKSSADAAAAAAPPLLSKALTDSTRLMQAHDCLAAMKNASCLGTAVCIARYRPPKVLEGPFLVEPNVALERDLKLAADGQWSVLTAVDSRESYLCTSAVADYYLEQQQVVRRCGLLMLEEPDAPLEQRALVHVRAGLNRIAVSGEEVASQALRSALKSKLVPFAPLVKDGDEQQQQHSDENYYLLELSFSSETKQVRAAPGERISTAQRKRMKKDAASAAAAAPATAPATSVAATPVARSCMLFGRVIFDEDDNKLVEIANDEDWLESCAHSMFASAL